MIKPSSSHFPLTNNKFYSEAVERMSVIDRLSEYPLPPFKACLCAGLVPRVWSMYSYRRQKLYLLCVKASGILLTDRQTDIAAWMCPISWYHTLVVFGKSPFRSSWMKPKNVINVCYGVIKVISSRKNLQELLQLRDNDHDHSSGSLSIHRPSPSWYTHTYMYSVAQQPNLGLGRFIFEVVYIYIYIYIYI